MICDGKYRIRERSEQVEMTTPSSLLNPSLPPIFSFPTSSSSSNSISLLPFTSFSYYSPSHSNFHFRQTHFATSVSFNPQGNYDLSLLDDHQDPDPGNFPTPLPPKDGRFEVYLKNDAIQRLDLSPFHSATALSPASSGTIEVNEYLERTIGFTIKYEREDPYDQRELSEMPDVRLWFVRLDAAYPWLPVLLDWRAGELARYAAMLVPHQMSMRMGVVFNPEALELFIMKKAFVVYSWMKQEGIPTPKARLKTADMARMLGFGIGDELFDLIDQHPL